MSDLVDFFVFLFGCVGITSIIVDGEIFKPVKDYIHNKVPEFFNSLLNCYQCSGFWVGIIFATVINYKYLNNLPNIASLILYGGLVSAASYFYALYLTYLEANSMVQFNDYPSSEPEENKPEENKPEENTNNVGDN